MRKKLLPVLLTLALAVALLTVGALADASDNVIYVNANDTTADTETGVGTASNPYNSLDAAVDKAPDGSVIEILSDVTTDGLELRKDLTIRGGTVAEGTEKYTIKFVEYGIALWGKSLTFENCNVEMDGIGSTPYTAEWDWMTICASAGASMTLNNVNMTMDAEGTTNSPHAIYFCNDNVLNIENGSVLEIKNYPEDALEWDGGNGGYNVNITDSTFISDHNRSGFTGTFYATITDSKVNVINSRGNGSNGSHFIIKTTEDALETPTTDDNTVVNFNNNGSHGLSAGNLTVDNSIVNAIENGYTGVVVGGQMRIINNSVITITGNSYIDDEVNASYGGLRINSSSGDTNNIVDSTSSLFVTNNKNTGVYVRNGNLIVQDGAKVKIIGNEVTNYDMAGYGGGIYVGYLTYANPIVVLPANAEIYNNHALVAGDDIYIAAGTGDGPSLTFGTVGTDWRLDGEPDCSHLIDGWYDDSANTRWEAHADTEDAYHVREHEVSDGAVTGTLALKAAHGLLDADVDTVTITPADIIVYTGGDSYEGSINDEEQIEAGNGLPTPGYFITLPDWVDEKYFEGSGTAADLTGRVRFVLDSGDKGLTTDDAGDRIWNLDWYTDESIGSSISIGGVQRFVYRMDADSLHNIPVRIQFTDEEGNTVISDDFTINLNDLYKTYRMTIYPGELNRESIKAQILDDDGTVLETLDVKVSENATLTIRGTTNAEIITGVGSGESDVAANTDVVNNDGGGAVTAIAPSGTEYYINESLVAVDPENVSLITDAVVETEPLRDYIVENDLAGRGENYVYRYLDLVDDTNGRAWVMATEDIEVYWSLPEGSSPTDNFRVIHFQGLDRQYDDLDAALAGNDPVIYSSADNNLSVVEIDGEYYLRFAVDTFSPFVLVWDTDGGDEPVIPPVRPTDPVRPQEPDGLNTEDHVAYIIGYPDGEVKPEGNITRAEVATIFFRLLTDETREEYWSQTNGYTDVARDAWYNNAISTLSNLGIIDGYEDGSFRPNSPITRAEFTKIAVSFFEYADIEYEGTFSDVAEGRWYTQFVAAAVEMGLIEGYPDGTFRPDASITRAEACTIVNRTLGRAPHEDHLLPEEEMITWPDNLYGAWYYADMQEATNSHDYEWTTEDSERVEDWTEKLPERDWDALEEIWSEANDAPGGEVIG